jgi:integral membrane protein (TIGR01906 family)
MVKSSRLQYLVDAGAALATAVVIVGLCVCAFLNPIWVGFEQDRSGVDQLTGYTPAEVRDVTGSILSDLAFGPPSFDAAVDGAPVLNARERSHMADVRTLLLRLGAVALAAAIMLVVLGLAAGNRRRFWRAVVAGASGLAAGVVIVGLAFALFFEQAFDLFHRIFFPPGTYLFSSADERLVQLFPDQFWSETSVAIAVLVLALALAAALVGRRLGREPGATSGGLQVEVAG